MQRSIVFREMNFLFSLVNPRFQNRRRRLIRHMTLSQIDAISEIVSKLTMRSIDIYPPDMSLFEDMRLVMRSIASSLVSYRRKRILIGRHSLLLTTILRPTYIYQTVAAQITDWINQGEE
jgi:hypothetical protein